MLNIMEHFPLTQYGHNSVDALRGSGIELQVIAAIVIGGVRLSGGVGSTIGTAHMEQPKQMRRDKNRGVPRHGPYQRSPFLSTPGLRIFPVPFPSHTAEPD